MTTDAEPASDGQPSAGTGADAADPAAFEDAVERLAAHYDVTADSRFVDLGGPAGRIHYLTAGDGPPLLALHGLGATGAIWLPVFADLTERFTVIAPDRPGRGLSTPVDYRETGFGEFGVEYLVALLDALGIDETAVVANSLGGFQALALARDHPERVSRCCLVGGAAGLSRSQPLAFRLFGIPVVGRWLFDRMREESVDDWRETTREMDVVDDSAIPDEAFEVRLRGDFQPGNRESLWSLLDSLVALRGFDPALDLRGDLPTIETPTRFVWGSEDAFWPPDVGWEAVESVPNADLVVLDDHGHVPWLEPGDEAIRAMLTFLDAE